MQMQGQMNSESNQQASTILALAGQVRDTSKSIEERREALRHICRLRNEPVTDVDAIKEDEINFAVGAMTTWSAIDPRFRDLTLADSLQAIREGRMRARLGII